LYTTREEEDGVAQGRRGRGGREAEVSYQWRLSEVMAAAGLFDVFDLEPLLAGRGITDYRSGFLVNFFYREDFVYLYDELFTLGKMSSRSWGLLRANFPD
jgi:hypothetical protein